MGSPTIRGSSLERNKAIASDLRAHLDLAHNVLRAAEQCRPMLLVQELMHRLEDYRNRINTGLDSGDDLSVIDFLSREVEPLFSLLNRFGPEVQGAIDKYRAALDPKVGTVYSLRKDFEDSGERLTQPGRIAVIYSSRGEAKEMKQHIDYLRAEGYFKGETEQLRLTDLPGVQGLMALRAEVNLQLKALAEKIGRLAA